MAMASSASCCFSPSSHGRPHHVRSHLPTTTTSIPARLRLGLCLVARPAPSRNPHRISSSPSPAPEATDEEEHSAEREEQVDRDERYGFEMEVRKLPGKKNRRSVRARVRVGAPLEAVWATLTDYEGLSDFITGLSECRLLRQDAAFARLYQVGEKDLALGFKFNARGTIDCYEGEIEVLQAGARRREIAFNMVEGDFKVFEGKWSVEEVNDVIDEAAPVSVGHEFQTTLSYVVELEPKLWVPVRLLEGRICKEIKANLVCIREEAERIQRLQGEVIVTNQASPSCNIPPIMLESLELTQTFRTGMFTFVF
ncbi:hypothetical protein ACQ4PT_022031 [Festuca glaucescens]